MSDLALTLFHEFARNKSLVASKDLGPTLDIIRASSIATFFDNAGVLRTAASGVARFDHDPVTLVNNGLLIEEARTNLCLQSERPTLAPWTVLISPVINETSAIAPDGTLSAISLNDNNGAGFEAIVQQISIPNDSAIYTFSMYIKKTVLGSAPTMGVNIVLKGGTNPGNLPIPRIFTDTGFIQDLQAGANSRIEDAGDWWRLISTVANNSTGHTIIEVQIYPATAANGFLPNIAQAVGINTVWGMQMEVGAFASSYIPTGAGVVVRDAEAPKTIDISNINTLEGVFYIDFTTGNIGQDTTVLSLDSEMSSKRMALEIINGNIRFRGVAGGAAQWNISTAATADTDYRAAIAYKANDIAFYLNGTQVGVDSFATLPAVTTLHIGCDFNEREQLNEHVREGRHYNIRKPNQFLEDLSSGLISEDNDLTFIRHLARPLERPLLIR